MLDHLAIQCADLEASTRFYDAVLAPLGFRAIVDFDDTLGYGRERPELWIGKQNTGDGFRESHLAFQADSRDAVRGFFSAATGVGAEVLYEPREWPEYHPGYFAAFVRDPDGNNIEAVCHTPE